MSYKVFTNGSPLPASDLNTFLMNQSVITFANATERDATLTAPTEGMCVFLENNNHFQIYYENAWHTQNPINAQGDLIIGNASGNPTRLAIGANGSIPIVGSGTLGYLPIGANGTALQSNGTTASWQPFSSGGLTLLSSGTLSGSTVTLSSISQDYKSLELWLWNVSLTSNSTITVQSRTGTTALPHRFSGVSNNVIFQEFSGAISPYNIKANSPLNSFTVRVDNYTQTNNYLAKTVNVTGAYDTFDSYLTTVHYGGAVSSTTNGAINGMIISTPAAFNGGNFRLWGVN